MAVLAANSYGKARVRLARIAREGERHGFRELDVDVRLRGDFDAAYTAGDNANVLPTDTMKNTVRALAHGRLVGAIESFAADLARHFVETAAPVAGARIEVREVHWDRMTIDGAEHSHAFVQRQGEVATAAVEFDGAALQIESGLTNLVVLKTTASGFSGFLRDAYTTLADTDDRILGTNITAGWTCGAAAPDFDRCRADVRGTLLRAFAEHPSPSVQATLQVMAEAVLAVCPDIASVTLSLPNLHYLPLDLEPFGTPDNHEIFVPAPEPYGLIEATVRRAEGN